ncbi:MAG TPA: hypothetical protein VFN71_05290 [Methylomirabilota bacterium]|nr:hypothetical protein [Methylomirabilota bacterium]
MAPRALRRLRFAADVALIAGFLGAIALPLGDLLVGLDPTPALTEKRTLAPPPKLRPGEMVSVSYIGAFESWWNDTFGFRRALVRQYSRLQLAIGVSPTKRVILGKSGWLYFAEDDALAAFRAVRPFTEDELARWQRRMEARRDWLAQRGARFLVVVAPSKETIYPEFMPDALNRVRLVTRLDQLLAHMRERSTVEILDLRPGLLAAKATGIVYLRTDTHWNDQGAALASREIARRLASSFPRLAALPEPEFETVIQAGWSGDLAAMLSLDGRLQEPRLELRPLAPRRARIAESSRAGANGRPDITVAETSDRALPRAVMFHDSFGVSLIPFLSERFARIVYWSGSADWRRNFDRELVEGERPEVVIQEIAERLLVAPAALLGTVAEGP